jgi:dinuclear metal center YbgI/SA1388 family protein
MKIYEIVTVLEKFAPLSLQESYDNAGLLIGDKNINCTGIICSLDVTEEIVKEAIKKKCNLIVAHHPLIFGGLKKIVGSNFAEKTIISAIKNDIAIYAIHTNLDNIHNGVNKIIADKIGLINTKILAPKNNILHKLFTYVPLEFEENIKKALFTVGAGQIGNYNECSFSSTGFGTFKANKNAKPFVGKKEERHTESEVKIELIFPNWLQQDVIKALLNAHPYEEPAFDIIPLNNQNNLAGSGLIGDLKNEIQVKTFLNKVSEIFDLHVIRHSNLIKKTIKKVAVCGGAGSFLVKHAMREKADIYLTSDLKYHDFFEANNELILADIGHFESEQFTIDLLQTFLQENFPNFAVLKTKINTNSVKYFIA